MEIKDILTRSLKARRAAHSSLALHESSNSRVILLEDLANKLDGSPVDVKDYFNEAILCLENKLYRSGIVLAWAGHFHVMSEVLYQTHEKDIRSVRSNWKFKDLIELTESYSESHILIVAKEVKFISKATYRILDGQLSVRNQCAHPTIYRPSMNAAIGYVDDLVRQTLGYLGMIAP